MQIEYYASVINKCKVKQNILLVSELRTRVSGKGELLLLPSMSKRLLPIILKLASLFSHQKKEYFQIASTERLVPKLSILFRNFSLAS